MGVTQTGVYGNGWVISDGNPSSKADHLPPISGRGRPQTLFSAVKEQDPSAKVSFVVLSRLSHHHNQHQHHFQVFLYTSLILIEFKIYNAATSTAHSEFQLKNEL